MNVAVIGAGPVGCYAGYLFAKEGHAVTIYENHPQIGSPVQCTGLLTSDFDELNIPKDGFLVNTFSKIEVNTPNHKTTINQKEYLVCRIKFDNYFADLARNSGAKILVNHSFLRKEGKNLVVKDTGSNQEKTITPDVVLAADGPLSPTAKAYGLYHPQRTHYYGIQATVQGSFDHTGYQTYFSDQICPGLFAWVVPESSTMARVGVATLKNTKYYFDKFMKDQEYTAMDIQAGAIPIYHPQQIIHQDNCYLLGDAAGFVKATTLGGLIPGLKQAEILADCVLHNKNYEKEIKPLAKKLRLHLKLRQIFDKFKDQDWDKLVSLINQPKIKKVFEEYTRENPFPLVLKSILKEPRLLYFAKYVL